MKITLFDTETTGLDTEKDLILELAYADYDVCEMTNTWRLVYCESALIDWDIEYVIEPKIEKLIGLRSIQCKQYGHEPRTTLNMFLEKLNHCDFVAGQNILGYDNKILVSNAKRVAYHAWIEMFHKLKFMDTYYDLPLPEDKKAKSLKYFALDHGYVLNGAHQAMNDVFACAHIMSCYPIGKIIEISQTPLVKIQAFIQYGDQKSKDLLYSRGFRWDQSIRGYQKTVREFYLKDVTKDLSGNCAWDVVQLWPLAKETTQNVQEELPF